MLKLPVEILLLKVALVPVKAPPKLTAPAVDKVFEHILPAKHANDPVLKTLPQNVWVFVNAVPKMLSPQL